MALFTINAGGPCAISRTLEHKNNVEGYIDAHFVGEEEITVALGSKALLALHRGDSFSKHHPYAECEYLNFPQGHYTLPLPRQIDNLKGRSLRN